MKNILALLMLGLLSCSFPSEKGANIKAETKDDSIDVLTTVVVDKCDIERVVNLSKKLDNPDTDDVLNFLLTISKDCRNNVEYMQFSNEVLFGILSKQPETIIQLVESNDKIEKEEFILYLSNPINDGIDVLEVIESLKSIPDNEFKSSLIHALSQK